MILSTISLCAIVVYREARGTDFKSQYLVASTVYNRAISESVPVDVVIFKPRQYSSMTGTKKRLRFNSWNEMLSYYKIKDMNSFASALNACGFAQDNQNNIRYFHDNRINNFSWNTKMKVAVKTKDFKFY